MVIIFHFINLVYHIVWFAYIEESLNKSKHKNNKCFSWVTAVRVLSLARSHSPPHFPRIPSNTVLICGHAVGGAQILIRCYFWVFPPMFTAIRTSGVFLWELSMTFNILNRHRVCLVDHVDLICSLYSLWEGFGSSSLATLPLDFNCGFISTSSCKSYTGFAPVRARCGGGAAAWVTGVLVTPGTQGSWWLVQQEI